MMQQRTQSKGGRPRLKVGWAGQGCACCAAGVLAACEADLAVGAAADLEQ